MAEGGSVDTNADKIEPISLMECAVCLQTCVHPAELPCGHIFCFLCIKGIAFQSGRCAMCREAIPVDFLYKPKLLTPVKTDDPTDNYQWYYEGGTGWWQYDPRASAEIEESYGKGEKSCNLLLAGFLYVIDFSNMVQYRQTNPVRRRRIKRDRSTTDKLGVAGLTENVLKRSVDELELGLQRLWTNSDRPETRTVQPGAESAAAATRLTRQESENYGLESLGPEVYQGGFDFRTPSPSQRDGRCFNPRLDLGESDDDDSDGDDGEENQPRRIMSGPSSVSPGTFRPLPMRVLRNHSHSEPEEIDLEIDD